MNNALCIALCCLFIAVTVGNVRADSANIQNERAKISVNIFAKHCFVTLGNHEKVISLMKQPFVEFEDKKKRETFLELVRAEAGKVWAFNSKKGNFILISEPNDKCHVIPQKAGDKELHGFISDLAKASGNNLPHHNVVYSQETKDGLDKSYIDVAAKVDGYKMLYVVATTMPNPPSNKPSAIISLIPR
ncbi:MAG: NMCC_0638 family (lipo)protein [Alphaproteobacteria bacterium]